MTVADAFGRALKDGTLSEFKLLMKAHPKHIQSSDERIWFFHRAAAYGHVEFLEFFHNLGVDVNAVETEFGHGPEMGAINNAAGQGRLKAVAWLLDHGAKINHVVEGQTCCYSLVGAVSGGYLDVVKLLVGRGADVNANWRGMTPLSYALMYGQSEIEEYLRSVGASEPATLRPHGAPRKDEKKGS